MTLLSTDQIDLALDDDGDLLLVGGDTPLTSGKDGLKQAVQIAILLSRGEWFLDLEAGTDWYGAILSKGYNPDRARDTILESIQGVDGIVSVDALTLTLDSKTRTLTINWRATASFGDSVADTLAVPV